MLQDGQRDSVVHMMKTVVTEEQLNLCQEVGY